MPCRLACTVMLLQQGGGHEAAGTAYLGLLGCVAQRCCSTRVPPSRPLPPACSPASHPLPTHPAPLPPLPPRLPRPPQLPKLFELVGLGYTTWFTYRYLLFKSSREELVEDIESLKKKIRCVRTLPAGVCGWVTGWLVWLGCVGDWVGGWLGWLAGWGGWLAGWLAGWLGGCVQGV